MRRRDSHSGVHGLREHALAGGVGDLDVLLGDHGQRQGLRGATVGHRHLERLHVADRLPRPLERWAACGHGTSRREQGRSLKTSRAVCEAKMGGNARHSSKQHMPGSDNDAKKSNVGSNSNTMLA